MIYNRLEGLMISNAPVRGFRDDSNNNSNDDADDEDEFIFEDATQSPNLNIVQNQQPSNTPITQLRKEILEDHSPAVSIDSLGFQKIQPLSVSNDEVTYQDDGTRTSPLKLKKSRRQSNGKDDQDTAQTRQKIAVSQSLQTLNSQNTFYSFRSSASDTTSHDSDNAELKSTTNGVSLHLNAVQDDMHNLSPTTQDSESLLDDINTPVIQNFNNEDLQNNKNTSKFMIFSNHFAGISNMPVITTKNTASSYYGEYNDGYLSDGRIVVDNDATPIVPVSGEGDKFESQSLNDNQNNEDLNKTPLVRQGNFGNTPSTSIKTITPPTSTSTSSSAHNHRTKRTSHNHADTPQNLKKTNSGKFLSKFKRKIIGANNKREVESNHSKTQQAKNDLTSMEHDLIREDSYTAYAAAVLPPPPPSPPQTLVSGTDPDEFDFVSSKTITIEKSNFSTLNQKLKKIESPIPLQTEEQKEEEVIEKEEEDSLYHLYKPQKIGTLMFEPTPSKNASDSLDFLDEKEQVFHNCEDDEEVQFEELKPTDISLGMSSRKELRLSPVKPSKKKSEKEQLIKSPNELNKDIFESFRPSYIQTNTVLSPSSSFYPDNISPLTYDFSVGTSQLDKHEFLSPTESTFSSTNDRRHTQVKLLNRSTTNLRHVYDNNGIVEDEEELVQKKTPNINNYLEHSSAVRQMSHFKGYTDKDESGKYADIDLELANHEDDNFARLFLTATHSFDVASLESQDEAARCLSFQKDDIAFIHDISESSGWVEVTLLSYHIETGWVPLNYFKPTIDEQDKQPLLLLFKAAGNFLSNKQSKPVYSSRTGNLKGYSFSYSSVDKLTIGIKYFLREIGCLSSKNENVYLSKTIREVRKKLLQDWHILRQKSRDYIGTISLNKIELLELLVYQVLMKAILFMNIWKSENIFRPKANFDRFKFDTKAMPYLSYTPTLRERVKEDSAIFISYFSMIIGRMDLIEHNLTGVKLLHLINEHVELLYLDFKFVVVESLNLIKDEKLMTILESFGKLIRKFDRNCTELIDLTNREYGKLQYDTINVRSLKEYAYTDLGKLLLSNCANLIIELSKMTKIDVMFPRSSMNTKVEHTYLDFQRVKIDTKDFIREASFGLLESKKFNEQLRKRKGLVTPKTKNSNRFSVLRGGNSASLTLTPEGIDLLSEMLEKGDDESRMSPMFKQDEFMELTGDKNLRENPYYIKNLSNEILKDANGVLIGSSFRGLVYFLTNELDEPSQLYISTFFLCYRIFSSGEDLLDALISRYESSIKEIQSLSDIRIKNRRKLVLKMVKIWLSSYWKDDYLLLPKLMNFLNESASDTLPVETLQLIKLVATLIDKTDDEQLVSRVLLPDDERRDTRFSIQTTMSMDDENYELTLIHSNESLNSLVSSSSSSISRIDVQEIELVNDAYKRFMGPSWYPNHNSLHDLIGNWYHIRNTRLRFPQTPLQLLNYHSLDIAKQLTLIESELFNNIKIEELLNENFTEKKLHLNLSPNVQRSILFTNLLSGYVLETILQPDLSLKQRLRLLTKWLKIALNCFNLKNFNSLAAVMTSLQSFLISRCVNLWNSVNGNYKKLFNKLIKIIQPDKNYLIYRRKLSNYLKEEDQIIVPYLNLFLQDLTFIVEGNSNYRNAETFLNQKLINIDKYFKITKILGDLQKLQKKYQPTTSSSSSLSVNFIPKSGSSNSLKKTFSSSSKLRKSLSRLSLSSIVGSDNDMNEIIPLQELIFVELLRVHQLNVIDDDRAWKLSCLIQPREN